MRRSTKCRSRATALLERIWYGRHPLRWLLWPASLLFALLTGLRYRAYQLGWLRRYRAPVPVIVVGNISAGGTGKTPFSISLCQALQARGRRPGIVSRGYGGEGAEYPLDVTATTDPALCGDEPLLLAQRTGCPLVVDPLRVRATRSLLARHDVDIIVSDDGLQHYALQRDVEIVIVDGQRRHGNGLRLPAGPLREPLRRLQAVDLILVNGPAATEPGFDLEMQAPRNLLTGEAATLDTLRGQAVHAVAGIGNPQRFFASLRVQGLQVMPHAFADHHRFTARDLDFGDSAPLLMTEKDAVKCRAFAQPYHWYLPVNAVCNPAAAEQLGSLLDRLGSPGLTREKTTHG